VLADLLQNVAFLF